MSTFLLADKKGFFFKNIHYFLEYNVLAVKWVLTFGESFYLHPQGQAVQEI
jgi:hypothetical protein